MVLTDDFLLNQCCVLVQMAESHTETFIDVWAGKSVQEWLISELEKECTGRMWRFSVFLQPLVYKARLMLTFSHPDQVVFTRLMLIWLNYLTFLHCAFSNVFSNCLQDCKSRLCILHSDMILTKLYLLDTGHVLMLLWIHPWLHQVFPSLLCMRSCNHQEWQTWIADRLWCLMQECKTKCMDASHISTEIR